MFIQCDILDEKYTKLRPLNLGHEDCQSKHTFGPAVRTFWLLHYVVSGKGKYIVNDTEYAVYPGQAFLIRPGEITTYQADEKDPWHYVWSAFDADIDKLFELPYILDIPEDDARSKVTALKREIKSLGDVNVSSIVFKSNANPV